MVATRPGTGALFAASCHGGAMSPDPAPTPSDPGDPAGPARLVLGPVDALVTITEFGDLECPYCRAAGPVLREVVAAADGQARLVWRHFPLFEVHPHALVAALTVEAAAAQGVFWPVQETLLADQDHLSEAGLRAVAAAFGVDPALAVGPGAQQYAPLVEQDYLAGLDLGVRGTPTLFVAGRRYDGPVDVAPLLVAVRAAAKAAVAGR